MTFGSPADATRRQSERRAEPARTEGARRLQITSRISTVMRFASACTSRSCVSACHAGMGCTSRSRLSACHAGRGCRPRRCASACHAGRGCRPRSCASACHAGMGCTSRSRFSACHGGSPCSPRSCISPCHANTVYSPPSLTKDVSFAATPARPPHPMPTGATRCDRYATIETR